MIRIKNLTKNFGNRNGIFDLSFEVQDGETFGLLGPQGAGKTTVMQLLMGFLMPTSGRCSIHGKNCSTQASAVKPFTGYLPSGAVLPKHMTGISFLRFMAQLQGVKSLERAVKLAERFELELDGKIEKMSKSERQKAAIACAFMHDPAVLLLDEPAFELEPFMKNRLLEFLLEEKGRGKTILFTSRHFEDAERICDRVGILRRGNLVKLDDIAGIRMETRKMFRVSFLSEQEATRFVRSEAFEVREKNGAQLVIAMSGNMRPLLQALGNYEVLEFENEIQNIEEIFQHLYGGDYRV